MGEAREFRSARPPLRELVPVAVLTLFFVILAPQIVAHPSVWRLVGLTGTALLIAGGIWLRLRDRFPGDPTLKVDAEGMSYRRGGREQRLKWTEVAAIRADFTLDRMLFIPTSGQKPIAMRHNMVTADGQAWAMLIEEYWQPPEETDRRPQDC